MFIKLRSVCLFFSLFAVFALAEGKQEKQEKQTVSFDSDFFSIFLNENTQKINQKQLLLLKRKQKKRLDGNTLSVGSRFLGLIDYQSTNTPNHFGWLMRFPGPQNQAGSHVSEAIVHSAQIALLGNMGPWFSYSAQILYHPSQNFLSTAQGGNDTITGAARNTVGIRKAYVVWGNLDRSPVFLTLGKFQAPFGLTDTVNPFTTSMTWHVFAGLSYGLKAEYFHHGLNGSIELAQGGPQFRALNSVVNEGDQGSPSHLNNYVLDLNYTYDFGARSHLLFGGSYMAASSYCAPAPTQHFANCDVNVPAFDFYTQLTVSDLTALFEFGKTTRPWPGTTDPTNPVFADVKAVKPFVYDIGLKYRQAVFDRVYDFSASFGEFVSGDRGTEFRRQNQLVFGVTTQVYRNVHLFSEYVHINGFVPFVNLTGIQTGGGWVPGPSIAHAKTDVVLLGIDATI